MIDFTKGGTVRPGALATYVSRQKGGSLPTVSLSIQQPWAWLIVHGHKDIENRTWVRRAPPCALIHAGQKTDEDTLDSLLHGIHPVTGEPLDLALAEAAKDAFERGEMHTGGFVGVANFGQAVPDDASPWFVGPWGYPVSAAKPLPFLPWRGMLGFFAAKVT